MLIKFVTGWVLGNGRAEDLCFLIEIHVYVSFCDTNNTAVHFTEAVCCSIDFI
jgi:hypothetical protein